MRRLLLAAACLLPSAVMAADQPAPGPAPDIDLVLTANEQAQWGQAVAALDQCVAAAMMRRDVTTCAGLSTFLAGFAGRVSTAPPVQAKGK